MDRHNDVILGFVGLQECALNKSSGNKLNMRECAAPLKLGMAESTSKGFGGWNRIEYLLGCGVLRFLSVCDPETVNHQQRDCTTETYRPLDCGNRLICFFLLFRTNSGTPLLQLKMCGVSSTDLQATPLQRPLRFPGPLVGLQYPVPVGPRDEGRALHPEGDQCYGGPQLVLRRWVLVHLASRLTRHW
jgi:hypothetical protein